MIVLTLKVMLISDELPILEHMAKMRQGNSGQMSHLEPTQKPAKKVLQLVLSCMLIGVFWKTVLLHESSSDLTLDTLLVCFVALGTFHSDSRQASGSSDWVGIPQCTHLHAGRVLRTEIQGRSDKQLRVSETAKGNMRGSNLRRRAFLRLTRA